MNSIRVDSRKDHGIVLVLVALAMTVIMGAAAVAIDLGTGYSSSRQVQNASDDAALAATHVLECYDIVSNINSTLYSTDPNVATQYDCPTGLSAYTAAQVATTATHVAQSDNGAQGLQCSVITYYGFISTAPYYSVLGDCSNTSSWSTNANADGVYVLSNTSEATSFGKAVGVSSLTQHRQAASTIQPFLGIPASGIILVCGGVTSSTQQTDTSGNIVPALVNYNSVTKEYELNTAKTTGLAGGAWRTGPVYNGSTSPAGPILELHGPQVDTCGLGGNSWKGIGNSTGMFPNWFPVTTGDRAGPIRVAIAGFPACTDLTNPAQIGCVLPMPVCTDGMGNGSNGQLYCVAWGAFELMSASANQQDFAFIGAATVTSGSTGTGPPTNNGINVIQLVQ